MKLDKFAKQVTQLKKTFMSPERIDVFYIDKEGNKRQIDSVDSCFYGTDDNHTLIVTLYERTPKDTDLPF